MRRKRHSLVYDQAGIISDTEIKNAIERHGELPQINYEIYSVI